MTDQKLKDTLTKIISQDGWVDTHEVDVEGQVTVIQRLIEAEKLALLDELDKALPRKTERLEDFIAAKRKSLDNK